MAGRLAGKTAIVTGAGRGIGREVALLFAQEGCKVLVNDLGTSVAGEGADTSPAAQTVADIRAAGGEAIAHFGDVADLDAAEDMVRTVLNEWGQLDILVNVAGILRDRMVFNMTEEEWDAVVRVHMKGTFATTKFASLHWRQARNGGRLINFTSGSGLFGAPGQPNYAAAKMGIWGFTLSCARALGRYGVTANSIAPGAATRMTDTVPAERSAAGPNRVTSDAAKGTERDPANIAPPLVYLASDAGGWISGRCFGIAGYRITLYSNIAPQVVLQGSKMWTVDELFERMEPTFKPFIQPIQ
ncbi:SDR family NAD(P)-dependent oxidoreductase [Tepidiforma thermophila]|uniref:NAD(P)-dependent dehydrogenase (Short-subunit alcohol dehydrogenase family) n=1 Tax=Tepidiforma thermophila (strain KCTC 52669 / CGMCC 1.13589 / G233) TaxID=2761530 RepID=A0A2A9HJG0_TEPT2|nr:SDR family NAD(P)-dependent oxidoreductase [Tepidiforma thermophila]PFG75136.1 NAD(P)-dependent dehydrogenase (short-subunit alcohol dehydrogenase family) [Tepidiforma thermophila]